MMKLLPHQEEAIKKMHNGCILVGDVGSGKTFTSLYYYYCNVCGGSLTPWKWMDKTKRRDLYVITTAMKRDSNDWYDEAMIFRLSKDRNLNHDKTGIVVDSWNNIGKYVGVKDAFFIFDEQRLVSTGSWSKAFLKIAKANQWILLSATPGDVWMDYLNVFIANGYFRNKSEFTNRHCQYARFSKYPKIERYLEEGRLLKMRKSLVVIMKSPTIAEKHHIDIYCNYNKEYYNQIMKTRFNDETNQPCKDAGEVCRCLRKVVNLSPDRIEEFKKLVVDSGRCIVFYNYNYELELLRYICEEQKWNYAEWNGHKHEPIPDRKKWVYLVQYVAGAEGWNCIETDTIIFYSNNYSYKIMKQSSGRIDRMNTPYKDLYYYHLTSKSTIDRAIKLAIDKKRMFNEGKFVG